MRNWIPRFRRTKVASFLKKLRLVAIVFERNTMGKRDSFASFGATIRILTTEPAAKTSIRLPGSTKLYVRVRSLRIRFADLGVLEIYKHGR